ncbi:MAG: hypothetical protein M9888_05065 [Chitinophagales bacterium]|nr:hypothetical protein [Chitinophagales bacterium]
MNRLHTLLFLFLSTILSLQAETLVNEGFRSTLSSPWTGNIITYESGTGGYQRFTAIGSTITSPSYNWSSYTNIKVEFQVAKYGSGTDGPISIQVSDDGGSTWTAFSANGATPSSSSYVTSSINLPNNINKSNLKIRFIRTNSPSEKRFRDLVITGDVSSCTAPSTTPEGFATYSTATENTIDLEWLDGNGAGRVIKMNSSNSFTNLANGANPSANTLYSGSGEQVVYNGTGSSPITITDLLPNTTYYFIGYEYCSPDRVYNNSATSEAVTTDIGSTLILTDDITFGTYCNGSDNNINVSFDATGSFNQDFKVQISDENGNFSNNLTQNIIGSGSASPISAVIPANYTVGTKYRVRVINEDPITIGTNNGHDFTINATPSEPTNISPSAVCEGQSIAVTGTGSNNATSYTFWDASTNGNQITNGVSGNTLTLDNTTPAGTYTIYIQGNNATCSSSRKEVILQVNSTPSISGSFTYSSNPSCGPVIIGFDAGYYFQTTSNGILQDKPTTSTYTLNSSGTIYVRAFNGSCWSDAIASNAVTIASPINISTQPSNISVPENSSGTMNVVASNVVSYQWQENDGNGWANMSGENAATLSFNSPSSSKNGYNYRVIMTGNSPCSNDTSSNATLTVTAPIAGSLWSNNITGTNPGNSNPYTAGQVVNNNITVSGIGRSGVSPNNGDDRYNANGWSTSSSLDATKYFTWTLTANSGYELSVSELNVNLRRSNTGPNKIQVRTSLDNFATGTEISYTGTANNEPFTFSINSSNVNQLEIRLYGYNASANTGTLSVNDFDFIGFIEAACSVDNPVGTFSYSNNPSCGPASISYDAGYYFQTTETGTSIASPTSSAYNLNSSATIYVRAYNGTCWSDAVASNAVVITPPISINNQPQNKTISSTGSGSMSVSASNVQSYQWQENDGSGWEDINGATSSSLVFNQPSQSKNGFLYRVVMTGNSPCTSVTSSNATLTVVTPSGPCSSPSGLNTNVNGHQVTFNWSGSNGADIHAVLLINDATGDYSKGFSPTSLGFTATIPSGTYRWVVMSLCNTILYGNGNASQWIEGPVFTVP